MYRHARAHTHAQRERERESKREHHARTHTHTYTHTHIHTHWEREHTNTRIHTYSAVLEQSLRKALQCVYRYVWAYVLMLKPHVLSINKHGLHKQCTAGEYSAAGSAVCTTCEANYYCPRAETVQSPLHFLSWDISLTRDMMNPKNNDVFQVSPGVEWAASIYCKVCPHTLFDDLGIVKTRQALAKMSSST